MTILSVMFLHAETHESEFKIRYLYPIWIWTQDAVKRAIFRVAYEYNVNSST